jgi:hypothetical protein
MCLFKGFLGFLEFKELSSRVYSIEKNQKTPTIDV